MILLVIVVHLAQRVLVAVMAAVVLQHALEMLVLLAVRLVELGVALELLHAAQGLFRLDLEDILFYHKFLRSVDRLTLQLF